MIWKVTLTTTSKVSHRAALSLAFIQASYSKQGIKQVDAVAASKRETEDIRLKVN